MRCYLLWHGSFSQSRRLILKRNVLRKYARGKVDAVFERYKTQIATPLHLIFSIGISRQNETAFTRGTINKTVAVFALKFTIIGFIASFVHKRYVSSTQWVIRVVWKTKWNTLQVIERQLFFLCKRVAFVNPYAHCYA